jgi:predicted MFS family arabinose efflux permease
MGLGFAWMFSRTEAHAGYKPYFFIAGGCILLSALLCMRLSPHAAGAPRARLILRRKYGLYYLLIFLEGCRRQIFSIFASYALILVYGMPLPMMLTLQWVNAILITVTAPLMGRLTDRYGERWTLMFYAVGLILVFTGYATSHNVITLGSLFLIDNILFTFGVGFTTYLHRIAPPEDLTPCLAMGTTMNHIAAVAVPVSGAWLWGHCHNYQAPFWVGVAVAVLALVATRWIPTSPSRAL